MADNDYNTVQPIEGLPNVLGVAPTEQQPQHQRRKAAQKDRKQHPQPASDDQTQTETPQESQKNSNHLIDYRA
jgi:hypothetical protein